MGCSGLLFSASFSADSGGRSLAGSGAFWTCAAETRLDGWRDAGAEESVSLLRGGQQKIEAGGGRFGFDQDPDFSGEVFGEIELRLFPRGTPAHRQRKVALTA